MILILCKLFYSINPREKKMKLFQNRVDFNLGDHEATIIQILSTKFFDDVLNY